MPETTSGGKTPRITSMPHISRPSGYSLTALTIHVPGVASCTYVSVNANWRQSRTACSSPIALTKTKGATAPPDVRRALLIASITSTPERLACSRSAVSSAVTRRT